ncbi:MAG: hypothetical protein R3Y21_03600 [Mycoplasmatota bacterium]
MNRKGFALSSILYGILVLALALMIGSLSSLANQKYRFEQLMQDVYDTLVLGGSGNTDTDEEIVYSEWVLIDELESFGFSTTDELILTKEQYHPIISFDVSDDPENPMKTSYTCSSRGSCSYSSCTTPVYFDAVYLDAMITTMQFKNTYASNSSSISATFQAQKEDGTWVTLSSKSGTRGTYSSATLTLNTLTSSLLSEKYQGLKLCWSMSDQNELYFSSTVTQYSTALESEWSDCDGECPDNSEIREMYKYPIIS